MFSRIRDQFGTAGLVVAIVALVAALGGAAYAASGLNGKQKKQVKKIAKKFAGKDGKNGAPGAPGAPGAKGDAGAPGAAGTPGAAGKNVEVLGTAPGCDEGGATVQVAGDSSTAQEVCNGVEGEEGEPGAPGEPWTPESELPPNATETGTFAAGGYGQISFSSAISFPVQLSAPLDMFHARVVNIQGEEFDLAAEEFVDPVNCQGTAEAPTAPSGFLCVYMGAEESLARNFPIVQKATSVGSFDFAKLGASTTGATLWFAAEEDPVLEKPKANARAVGTFAVTG